MRMCVIPGFVLAHCNFFSNLLFGQRMCPWQGEEAEESVPAVGHAPYFYLITDSREMESLGHVRTKILFTYALLNEREKGKEEARC